MKYISLIALLFLYGCGADSVKQLTYTVDDMPVVIEVAAAGELEAETSTPISIPSGIYEPQQIAWMVDENTYVKKGQVVARLNSAKYKHLTEQESFKQQQLEIDSHQKHLGLKKEETDISSDRELIKQELSIAEQFTIDDLRIFSKNEIIDKMNDKEFLDAKLGYNQWRWDSYNIKSETEMDLLKLQINEVGAKLGMYQDSLNKMEITAPHDGVFLFHKNWRGEKTQVGQMIFPGGKIGTLPDLSVMQARLYVLETESTNIKPGLPVVFNIDAYPDKEYRGKVKSVDPVAKARTKKNPVKYFQVLIEVDQTDQLTMRPGDQIQARIQIVNSKSSMKVPSIAVFESDGKHWVNLVQDGNIVKREVSIGIVGSDFTEVNSGIDAGDRIVLARGDV